MNVHTNIEKYTILYTIMHGLQISTINKRLVKLKLNEISEAPVDSRPRKLEKLYRCSERNKDSGVSITRAGTLAPVDYPKYPTELELHEYEDGPAGPGVAVRPHNEEDVFYNAPTASSLPAGYRPYSQLNYFRQLITAYNGYDSDVVKYVKKGEGLNR